MALTACIRKEDLQFNDLRSYHNKKETEEKTKYKRSRRKTS